jgi:hypothetical protein
VYYSWLNTTCHGEIFKYFDVDPTSLPTVLYYAPHINKYYQMIGKFDADTVADHEDRFKNGKLSLIDAKQDKKAIVFEDIDCAALVEETGLDADDDFDEILAEILAEEEERKRLEEEESGEKKSKKSSKKKKKKSKSSVRDEL